MKKIVLLILVLNSLVFSSPLEYSIVTSNNKIDVYLYDYEYTSHKGIRSFLTGTGSLTYKMNSIVLKERLFSFKNKSSKSCQEEVYWTQSNVDRKNFKYHTYNNGSRSIYLETTTYKYNDSIWEFECKKDSLVASFKIRNLSQKKIRQIKRKKNAFITMFLDSVYFTKRRWLFNY